MEYYDSTKWNVISPTTNSPKCDIATMTASLFPFDLDAFETACATATDCTFIKADYVPYAFGILWKEGATKCTQDGPIILFDESFIPMKPFYWNHSDPTDHVGIYTGVTYDGSAERFYFTGRTPCLDF